MTGRPLTPGSRLRTAGDPRANVQRLRRRLDGVTRPSPSHELQLMYEFVSLSMAYERPCVSTWSPLDGSNPEPPHRGQGTARSSVWAATLGMAGSPLVVSMNALSARIGVGGLDWAPGAPDLVPVGIEGGTPVVVEDAAGAMAWITGGAESGGHRSLSGQGVCPCYRRTSRNGAPVGLHNVPACAVTGSGSPDAVRHVKP